MALNYLYKWSSSHNKDQENSLPNCSVVRTCTGNMGNPILCLWSPAGKASPSCSPLHPRCKWRLLSSTLFSLFFCEKFAGFSFHPDMERGWSSQYALQWEKFRPSSSTEDSHHSDNRTRFCWERVAEKQSYWIWGGSYATFSITPFRKTSSKLNYVMAISSFKPSAGQVGAGPGSEQYAGS